MRGLGCLRQLIFARRIFISSKRTFHYFSIISHNEKNMNTLKTSNMCGFLRILVLKRLLSLQLENKQIQDIMLSIGFTDEEIENCVKDDSELLKCPAHKLHSVLRALSEQGLTENDIKHIFLTLPHIVQVDVNGLNKTITKWRQLKLTEEEMFRIFVKHPFYLLLTPEYIDSRLKQVVTVFTNSDVNVLLERMPSLFIDDWNNILRKVHYIQSHMGFTQIQMLRSNVLEHSMMHIKTRHMFIALCGVFKPRNPKKVILNNPSLKSIVDSTDKDFVKRCHLTLEEYYIFCDVMAEEEMESGDEEMESDDE